MVVVIHFLTRDPCLLLRQRLPQAGESPHRSNTHTHRCANYGPTDTPHVHNGLWGLCKHMCTATGTNSHWQRPIEALGEGRIRDSDGSPEGLAASEHMQGRNSLHYTGSKGSLAKVQQLVRGGGGRRGTGAWDMMRGTRRPPWACEAGTWSGVGTQGQSRTGPGLPSWPPPSMAPICTLIFWGRNTGSWWWEGWLPRPTG